MPAAPVAWGGSLSVVHDRVLTANAGSGLLVHGYDPDNDALTATITSGPSHGTLTTATDGSFAYQADTGRVGVDSFRFVLSDATSSSDEATITLDVTNSAPYAYNNTFTVAHDHALTESMWYALARQGYDMDGDALTATVTSGPAHGTFASTQDGGWVYTADAGYVGTDSLRFALSDGIASSEGTLTFNVTNSTPYAYNTSFSVAHDHALTESMWYALARQGYDMDGDALTATVTAGPAHGTFVTAADGGWTYTADAGFVGTDSLHFVLSDGIASSEATLSFNVTNSAPYAYNNTFSVVHDHVLTEPSWVGLAHQGYDMDGDALTATVVAGPAHGTFATTADGGWVYTANTGYAGTDSLRFALSDGVASSEATLTFNVTNSAPYVSGRSFAAIGGQTLTISASSGLLSGAYDDDGDALTASLAPNGGPAHGTVVVAPDGSLVYTPEDDFQEGTDSFSYAVSDGVTSSVATAQINVRPLIHLGLIADRQDIEGAPVSFYVAATAATGATVTYVADGLPEGVSLNASTGLISGAVAAGAAGQGYYFVRVTAGDGVTSHVQDFEWDISSRIIVTEVASRSDLENDTVTLQVTATSPDNVPLTYSADNLPTGLSIDPNTGLISGTVTAGMYADGDHATKVTVTDGTYSASTSFNWSVYALAKDQVSREGDVVSLQLNPNLLSGTGRTYAIDSGMLAPGLLLDAETGSISGTVAQGATGIYTAMVSVTKDGATRTQQLLWAVTPRITVAPIVDQESVIGEDGTSQPVTVALSATSPDGRPLTYTLTGQPDWVTVGVDAQGKPVLVGAPTVAQLQEAAERGAPYTITVTASDGVYSGSTTFAWNVTTLAVADDPAQALQDAVKQAYQSVDQFVDLGLLAVGKQPPKRYNDYTVDVKVSGFLAAFPDNPITKAIGPDLSPLAKRVVLTNYANQALRDNLSGDFKDYKGTPKGKPIVTILRFPINLGAPSVPNGISDNSMVLKRINKDVESSLRSIGVGTDLSYKVYGTLEVTVTRTTWPDLKK